MQGASGRDYKSLYEQQLQAYDALQITVIQLQQQLAGLQKMIFGSKHERFIPSAVNTSQLSLDIQAETTASCSVTSARLISYTKTNVAVEQKPISHPGRMKLPENLRREEIIIEPGEDISGCKKWENRSLKCWNTSRVNCM